MPLSAANGLFVAQMLEKIPLADSAFPLALQPICSEVLQKSRTDEEVLRASQYLMQSLEEDFLDELDYCGGQASHRPAPSRAAAALFGKGERELIDVVKISKNDWYAFGRIFLNGEGPFLEDLLRKLGEFLGVRDFLFEYLPSGPVILRFPPPSAYLGALAVFGDGQAMGVQPTATASTALEVRAFLMENRRPWRLDAAPYDVHGRKAQHPYIGALHDLLHALRLARIPAAIRRDLVAVFDCLQKVGVSVPRRDGIEEIALEGPFDDQMDARHFSPGLLYERLFRQMNAYLGRESTEDIKSFVDDFYARLREDFEGHPRGKAVLHAFAKEVYRKRA
ncbi:MAG TPA: hypothetical protein VLJ37_06545 [bacterium]|nr:hypothetical protein [bacterium]